jgi:hypothetical protein
MYSQRYETSVQLRDLRDPVANPESPSVLMKHTELRSSDIDLCARPRRLKPRYFARLLDQQHYVERPIKQHLFLPLDTAKCSK